MVYAAEAHRNNHLSGDGAFTRRCQQWIEQRTGCVKALLTQSCTSALELAALLLDLEVGDEVIMPSFTFVSTANAFVLRGAVPVFVDIREDTLNLDEKLIEAAITPRTRAIVPVHYAGVSCEMDTIAAIAARHNLAIVEDVCKYMSKLIAVDIDPDDLQTGVHAPVLLLRLQPRADGQHHVGLAPEQVAGRHGDGELVAAVDHALAHATSHDGCVQHLGDARDVFARALGAAADHDHRPLGAA